MRRRWTVVAATLVLAGCGGGEDQPDAPGLANPASVFCEEQGGTVDIRDTADGQVGFCVTAEGECEEWAFFRGECDPGG